MIEHFLVSPDTDSMVVALQSVGAEIKREKNALMIEGVNGKPKRSNGCIDAGNSGQVLRFVGALSAIVSSKTMLTGDYSIQNNRPIEPLLSGLEQLGAQVFAAHGNRRPPVTIEGPIVPGKVAICGQDSQPVSALLMAAAFLEGETQIEVDHPGETPWIDLTLSWLRRLGGEVSHQNYRHYTVLGPLRYNGFHYSVPGDLSTVAFPVAAALVTRSSLVIQNVDLEDIQGDKVLLEVLGRMGAQVVWKKDQKSLVVSKSGTLKGGDIDCNIFIDALPILAVIGCFARDKVTLTNAAIARQKESDRIFAIATELSKMGAHIEERDDGLVVYPSKLRGAALQAHQDHRIALALAVAALGAEGASRIEGVEVIHKSHPHFVRDFKMIGAQIEESCSFWF